MMRSVKCAPRTAALAVACIGAFTPLQAQQDTTELARIRRQIDALTRELEAVRLGQDVLPQADTAVLGFGPAASKVYRLRQGVSLGGYGEVLYENYAKENENGSAVTLRDQVDALRLIVYLGYKFSDRLLLNSEIEFEHGSTDQGGTVSVEFAYIDWIPASSFGLRGGMLLVPMGFLNELHEPPIFLGTTRPATENAIIPTTWRENGFGFFGEMADLSYRVYVVNGLDAFGSGPSRAAGFSAGGLRGGRQKGARALIEQPAFVARLDYAPQALLPGVTVGGSAYYGKSGQNNPAAPSVAVPTGIVEAHAQYRARGFDVRVLAARATLDDVAPLNQARGLTGAASVGETLQGWYVHGGFDLMRFTTNMQELTPYVRYERLDTQREVPTGFSANPANDRTITSVGLHWKPITNIVLKGDYQMHSNQANTGVNQFNVVLGYLF